MAGIGCHFMAVWMDRARPRARRWAAKACRGSARRRSPPSSTSSPTSATAPTSTRAAGDPPVIAAGVNITYKILYNDAVAMTGGQPIDGRLEGHGAARASSTPRARSAWWSSPTSRRSTQGWPGSRAGVDGAPPRRARRVQRELREVKGCTVIIYDQTCATEKRRRRKRGTLVDPAKRVVINELVCEGCGDCSVQSNCLSVEPVETEFGRKRRINQNTCNKDYSCLKGFCPSFVTVEGGS